MIITGIKKASTNLQDDHKDLSMVLISISAVLFLFINPIYVLIVLGLMNINIQIETTRLHKGLFRRLFCTLALWAFVINRQYGVSWGTEVVGLDDIPNYLDIFEKLVTRQIALPLFEPIMYLGAFISDAIGVKFFIYLLLISLFCIFSIVHLLFSVQTRPYTGLAFLVCAVLTIWDIWGHLSRTSLALGFFCFLLIDIITKNPPRKVLGLLSMLTHLSFLLVTPFYYLNDIIIDRRRWIVPFVIFFPGTILLIVTNYAPLTDSLIVYTKLLSYQFLISNINMVYYALAIYFLIFDKRPVVLISSALYLSTLFTITLGYGVITERITSLTYTILAIVLASTAKSIINISALYIGSLIIFIKNLTVLSDENSISLLFQYLSQGEQYKPLKGFLLNILEMRWTMN